MKKLLLLVAFATVLFSVDTGILTKTESGFVMKPSVPKVCAPIVIDTNSTGFLFTGRIIWGEPTVGDNIKGDPYHNALVFVSEGKNRDWEYVGKTNDDGKFSLPIKPYTQFKLYVWDGNGTTLAKYEGHFYYNSELDNLYMTPTGGEPEIADKGDVIVEKVSNE